MCLHAEHAIAALPQEARIETRGPRRTTSSKPRATSTLVLNLRARCSWTLHLNLRAMNRGRVARRRGCLAGVTPRMKEHGTSAIEDTRLKDTLRILKCGPQWIKNHNEWLRMFIFKDKQQARSDVPSILRTHGERLRDACPYLRETTVKSYMEDLIIKEVPL